MRVDDLRGLSIFEGLRTDQLAELVAAGSEVRVEPGVELFSEGEHADSWWVLLDGAIELWRHVGREVISVGHMDTPGRWAGGFRAWDEHGVYLATGRGVSEGRVLRLPSEVLRDRCNAWFPLGGHLIAGLYGTARSIESTVRQRDSLITLGTLAAGLAHEINNPAAAATRAVDALEDVSGTLVSALGRLAGGDLTATQFAALEALRTEIEPAVTMDPLAQADREDALCSWLEEHGVDEVWVLSAPLAAAGADPAWCERVAAALPGAALEPGLEWTASTSSLAALLAEVKESTRRVSDLVAAVRSYSQMDRASMQQTDVRDGLESTLVMMGHKIGDRIEVVRDYGTDVPLVEAYAGELNRVWTNLIDNAVDAMADTDGRGTLTVATRPGPDAVVVDIGDTGPGMAPPVAARAFEAFYTTKAVGMGTGLGLDTARRIVEDRHGGSIRIESRPGRTVLRVCIPLRPPRRPDPPDEAA
jgi:signal transduction histidine kinase